MTDNTMPEPVAWQRHAGPMSWQHVSLDDLNHYREKGSQLRPLYTAEALQAERDRAEEWKRAWYALDHDTKGYLNRATTAEAALAETCGSKATCDHVLSEWRGRLADAEAALADARKVIEGLESACNQLAATRSHAIYLAMVDDGQSDEMLSLDEWRNTARQWLSAHPAKETKGAERCPDCDLPDPDNNPYCFCKETTNAE